MVWIAAGCSTDDAGGTHVGDDPPQRFVARAEARCARERRVGLVEIYGEPGALVVWASLYGTPDPWIRPPSASAGLCAFYPNRPATPCDENPCPDTSDCGFTGACTSMSHERAVDSQLAVFGDGEEQVFARDDVTGYVGGKVALGASTIGLRVTWLGMEVSLAEVPLPPARLESLVGETHLFDSGPIAMAWQPVEDTPWASVVTTEIHADHHANSWIFVACEVSASAGALHVDGALTALLGPALEYGGYVDHVRFAAAETPLGCVEIRATSGLHRPPQSPP